MSGNDIQVTAKSSSMFHRCKPNRREGKIARILAIALCILGVLVLIGGVTGIFGMVTGVEFSPNAFERRSFYYYEVPILGIQIWPVVRTDTTGALEKHLATNKLVPALGAN